MKIIKFAQNGPKSDKMFKRARNGKPKTAKNQKTMKTKNYKN